MDNREKFEKWISEEFMRTRGRIPTVFEKDLCRGAWQAATKAAEQREAQLKATNTSLYAQCENQEQRIAEFQKEVERLTLELAAYEAMRPIAYVILCNEAITANIFTSYKKANEVMFQLDSDYPQDARELAALIFKPYSTEHLDQLLQQKRDKALEEAAQICERKPYPMESFSSEDLIIEQTCKDCAEAIRAAKKG